MGLRFQQFRRSRPRATALRLVRMMFGYPPKPERQVRGMSVLPPKADIAERHRHVRFVGHGDKLAAISGLRRITDIKRPANAALAFRLLRCTRKFAGSNNLTY